MNSPKNKIIKNFQSIFKYENCYVNQIHDLWIFYRKKINNFEAKH